MARKSEAPATPVVTSLPLPSSDSVLVIDLPDGQKLLVGKMSHGTVIEVATWRGTGRPDSRTNRLMLGMSSNETEPTVNSNEAQDDLVVDKRSIRYWIWFALQISKSVKASAATAISKVKDLLGKKKKVADSASTKYAIEDDVQAWLDNLKTNKTKALPGLPASTKSEITGKSAAKTPKSNKKIVKKGNSRSKG
jgi:hypothetical protein